MDNEAGQAEQTAAQAGEAQSPARACPACEAKARRADARFCSACGRRLDETYLPADALRASYSVQKPRPASRGTSRKPIKSSMASIHPARNTNGASTTALAFVTYALVPYLGILFCPGAVLMGGVGLYNSYRAPERGGRRASYASVIVGLLIFCAQLFLWWILYKIPHWSKDF
ncbi:MAG TPA: hypothetical protein VJ715_04400 [Pyrinomonadaceae bacterium]|nr:hypothetical protein [Pyrinomonadaceae bacterium]